MGSDRKDKQRALQWIEDSSRTWTEPLLPSEVSSLLNANRQLMFGKNVVKNLCDILVLKGVLITVDGAYLPKPRRSTVIDDLDALEASQ